ncbi:hypothetical protein E4T52_06196 [Aureobasidium sp. EXF-3400]|nr:hypothetical protein E4T51_05400 [Aureobasidium sp. EXF-12344]KAI4778934.1 hypothetical protein E4T52_06196 [Aureobasidium sp. EXF-3400]
MADATQSAPVVFKKRAGRANLKKRAATPPSASDSDYSSAEDESGARIKRRRKNGITTSSSSAITKPVRDLGKSTQFAGDRSAAITNLDDATKTSNWFHADEAAKAADGEEVEKDGTYRGAKGYGNFIQKNPDKLGKSVGPVKAPTNMRMITLVDFAPDVCKDYKQTGFCGFGDSCKFLHAREDYKQGWQLDKEWEKAGKSKAPLKSTIVGSANRSATDTANASDSDNDEEAKELEKIPFACIICKEPYKSPVVTKCGHYFCEACALKRHKSKGGKQCANCGADTGGTFNVAKNLRKLLDKKRERIRKRKEKARENGEEVSSDEE